MLNSWLLHQDDRDYPLNLQYLGSPPEPLYCMGKRSLLERRRIGIIGARKATPYGLRAARMFGAWAAANGIAVVSGAAIGCDQAAQRAALQSGGWAISVMGCGCDVDYPSNASDMLDEQRVNHLVISEHPDGSPPKRWTLRERNRLIAAMSDVLLVIEAALPSGTFGTVDHAVKFGVPVYAVPGSIFSPQARGCNRLISQGAFVLTDTSDLAVALAIGGHPVGTGIGQQDLGVEADMIESSIMADPMRPDDLAFALELDIITVARRLSELERTGKVARYRDGRYGPA